MLPVLPRGLPITELGLPAVLLRKITTDGVIEDTFDLRCLSADALRNVWNLTTANFERLNVALEQKGLAPMPLPDGSKPTRAVQPGCTEPGQYEGTTCGMVRMKGKRKCAWHWLLGLPIEKQIHYADARAESARALEGHVERSRVPEREWPAGGRWCADCQGFIPWCYITGSRCRAHASKASHASRIKAVYNLTREDFERLLAFQNGRCYICGQLPGKKRLAVDHDHRTQEVRGLLCANDEWGCNVSLRRLLNSEDMARRALEYVTMSPLRRMQAQLEDAPPPAPPAEAYNPWAGS